jgi:hypothetical protein
MMEVMCMDRSKSAIILLGALLAVSISANAWGFFGGGIPGR